MTLNCVKKQISFNALKRKIIINAFFRAIKSPEIKYT